MSVSIADVMHAAAPAIALQCSVASLQSMQSTMERPTEQLFDLAHRAAVVVQEWRRLARSRRELAALDDYQLRDLGLSRPQAAYESGKSIFRK